MLEEWVDLTDDEVMNGDQGMLSEAMSVVEWMLRLSAFPVDGDGRPTTPAHRDAIAEAVRAQYRHFRETGDVTGVHAGGVSIGSVSLQAVQGAGRDGTPGALVSPVTKRVLQTAGLLPATITGVWSL